MLFWNSPNRPRIFFIASLLALCGGCSDGGGSGPSLDPVLSRTLALDLANGVIIPTYQDFAAEAADLEAATATYASSLGEADRMAAREAWAEAMAVWQRAEVMQVGPAEPISLMMGGQDLREHIYSWNRVNRCRVDQELTEQNYQNVDTFSAEAVNVRGLDAIEYLLFREDTGNACDVTTNINTQGTWTTIVPELDQRRADYASTLAILVKRRADELVQAWLPSGGNFVAELETAGQGGTVYDSPQEALNAITNAMFYLDVQTKDMKVAEPVGIANCLSATCPEAVESDWAQASLSHVEQNLVAFQTLFLGAPVGTPANGFDDLLVTVGRADLATQMESDIAAAISAAQAVPPPLSDAVDQNTAAVEALYEAIFEVTTALKTDFINVLDLNRPATAAGDND